MALRKELSFKWQGEQLKKLVTFEIIERVDNVVNLNSLFRGEFDGSIKLTDKAKFCAALMSECGAAVEPGDIYQMMTNSKAGEAAELYSSMLWCCIGEEEEESSKKKKAKS